MLKKSSWYENIEEVKREFRPPLSQLSAKQLFKTEYSSFNKNENAEISSRLQSLSKLNSQIEPPKE